MIKVVVIGSGNVAQHLISAFQNESSINLVQVFARNKSSLDHLIDATKITSDYDKIKDADLYIISVSDDVIKNVSQSLPFKNKLVAHTSGSVAMENLSDDNRKAVFYPLQTFSKNKEINFRVIPICVETQYKSDLQLMLDFAKIISNEIFEINSEQRKSLHIAAVFVSNFVNHLYKLGNDICRENNVPFEILKPLISETANKVQLIAPREAQTGPAIRKDTTTINKHLAQLKNKNQQDIYKLITKSIIDHGNKL
jgi:predicted short-subunit dehydrogenase-like oxidoreductase (DUF2520 family)